MKRNFKYLLIMSFVNIWGCRKPYNPPAITAPNSYLVVEGVINAGADSTFIKLSKTVPLSSKTTISPVLSATVSIESDQGSRYPLSETKNGYYASPALNLDYKPKYRLRIKTNNEEYLSDFVPVVNSPAIDTVSYAVQSGGIQMYVSTRDPQNSAHYYRWEYQETWLIHSKYYSSFKSNGDTVIERNFINDEVYQCWVSDTSSTIVLGSSVGLSSDVINKKPVTFVASTSQKLYGGQSVVNSQSAPSNHVYSILVRQYALTGDAYRFWENLKKNTEQLGSIFDANPSQISGNIHSVTNPLAPVIGYISAGVVTSKRTFIPNGQIPGAWLPRSTSLDCPLDSEYLHTKPPGSAVFVNEENEFFNYHIDVKYFHLLTPISILYNKLTGIVIGHTGSFPECVDCTLKGTNIQPSFWK